MKRLLPFQRGNHHPVMFVAMNIALLIAFFSFGLSAINAAIIFPTITTRAKIQKQILLDVFTAVNTQRGLAGLSAKTFTALPSGYFQKIKMQNLQEARTAIEEIYTSKGVPLPTWTNPTLIAGQTPVRAVHFTELKAQLEDVLLHGIITTIAGDGFPSFSGDGGLATNARLKFPSSLVLDSQGNFYVVDVSNHRIRKITTATGIITTIAGTGTAGYSGDNGPATSARLNAPYYLAFDAQGNLYIADQGNHRIRKITTATGIITTIAGTGTAGYSGDNGPATSAQLGGVGGPTFDSQGNLYITDTYNAFIASNSISRIRKITTATGIITTIAGTGTAGYSGDNGPATSARLNFPTSPVFDAQGNLYVTDSNNHRIRKITTATGIITTIAGTGTAGYSGDNGPATSAQLFIPNGITFDAQGNLYVADMINSRIRKITTATGIITTIAGTGTAGYSGDNGPATSAQLNSPYRIVFDAQGNIYFSDYANHRIRKITK